MSSGSIASDLATANTDLNAVDTIIAGWISQYNLNLGANVSFNAAGFAIDGGNTAAGGLITRLQATLIKLQTINHG